MQTDEIQSATALNRIVDTFTDQLDSYSFSALIGKNMRLALGRETRDWIIAESPIDTALKSHTYEEIPSRLTRASRSAEISAVRIVAQNDEYLFKRKISLGSILEFLLTNLGGDLLAYLLVSDDPDIPVSEGSNAAVEHKLRAAHDLVREALEVDSPDTVRAWFAGMNESLGGISALRALREGRFKEAEEAVHDFIANG